MVSSPFLRPDAVGYPAIFADGLVHLLGRSGLDRWSVRELARWMKVTPAAVLAKYRRADVLVMAVSEYARRWVAWAGYPPYDSGLPASLPASAEEVHGVRVWWLLGELARSERLAGRPAAEEVYLAAEREERAFLARELEVLVERRVSTEDLTATAALVAGLRALLVAPAPALSAEAAQQVLHAHVARLRGPAPPQPQVPSPG